MSAVILRVVCAWCLRVLCEGTPGAATSHGMCPSCRGRFVGDVAARPPTTPVSHG